ncbi:MAG: glucuronate isomerase [Leptotrichiaceae bacterium]|nr:glucuronate isomerase [Leptotrichiaceae bacterium]
MKEFLNSNFLLETETAKKLFHEYAENMPIIDYHNHLNVREIYEDKKFSSITEAWLAFDHYKWRMLRVNGISEEYVTGDKNPKEKFDKWAETVPYTLGNPIFHWTHLELKRIFGIEEILSPKSSDSIFEKCNEFLKKDEFSARNLIRKSNVQVLCTTDDPKDDLIYHKALKEEFEVKVLPSYRPDNALHIEKETFASYISDLGKVTGYEIGSYDLLKKALIERLDYFCEIGCRVTDHGLDEMLYTEASENEAEEIFRKRLNGEKLSKEELRKYKGNLLNALGKEYNKRDLVMQLHIGPLRNNSTRGFQNLGPDAGYDSINDLNIAHDLSKFLDSLDQTDELPKTILYSVNAKDNDVLSSMAGNFQDGKTPGKIQFGTGWWFNDQKDGMEKQMESLAQMGMLARFIGMLTDSRSLLSFPRHEYFRRILCNKLGNLIESGQYPDDIEFVGKIVRDICYNNAKKYFGF